MSVLAAPGVPPGSDQPSDEDDEDEEETRHFLEVCYSFFYYQEATLHAVSWARHAMRCQQAEDLALWAGDPAAWVAQVEHCVAHNQRFLRSILAGSRRPGGGTIPTEIPAGHHVRGGNASKVSSTLRQFVRDWSVEGQAERDTCYKPLLGALVRHLPLPEEWSEDAPWTRVLCPGSGLGRLPFEASAMGYAAEGNEFSYHMILANQWILNLTAGPLEHVIYPFVECFAGRRGSADHLRPVRIPDVCPSDVLTAHHGFSMAAGEFVEVYGAQTGEWDAVLTPFFIDTAKNIFLYIRTIAAIIRPGGLWANVGPLLWHYADVADEVSIEVSWEEVRPAICRYFDIREERRCLSYYTSQPGSLKRTAYNCIFFAAIRNVTPVEGRSNPVY